MNRRQLIGIAALLPFAPQMVLAADAATYSAEAVKAELDAGKIVVLDFSADWCSSCQAQGRTIASLRAENPDYDARIAFFVVDWDAYKNTELAQKYGVTSRGSLVLLKGDAVVAKTDTHSTREALRALFDQASA